MRTQKSATLALIAFTLGAASAAAQDTEPVVVTPYVALASGTASPLGTAITFPVARALAVETDLAYRQAEDHIHALNLNASLLYLFPRVGRSTPYVAAGIGLWKDAAPVVSLVGGRPTATQSRLAMAVNTGGGLKTRMTEKTDLRTDARWFKILGRQGPSEGFRVAQGLSFDLGRR